MKIALRLLSLSILVVVTMFYTGCKDKNEDPDSVEKQQLEKLVADWTLESATDSQGDRTSDFSGLVLHVTGNYTGDGKSYGYNFTGTRPDPSPWPESGFWKFGTNKATELIRDPGTTGEIPMTYTVSATDLTISFTVPDNSPGWPGGRIENVIGQWTFTFTK